MDAETVGVTRTASDIWHTSRLDMFNGLVDLPHWMQRGHQQLVSGKQDAVSCKSSVQCFCALGPVPWQCVFEISYDVGEHAATLTKSTGRIRDRTRPMLQKCHEVLAGRKQRSFVMTAIAPCSSPCGRV